MLSNDVLIACEFGPGQSESANARLVAFGSRLARHWGGRLLCLIGASSASGYAETLGNHIDETWITDFGGETYDSVQHMAALRAVIDETKPRAVLFAHTFIGMDLAPRIAARMGAVSVANCQDVEPHTGGIRVTRPMYRGKLVAQVEVEAFPVVATVQPGGPPLPPPAAAGTVRQVRSAADGADSGVRHIRVHAPVQTEVDITKSEVIVAGGRGIGERESFALVSDLAEALGGEYACSRPLVDMGWFGVNRQVGLSGNSVKPRLYVACGISGASEHLHGMKEAGTIVAINSDPAAPIFKVAHFGVVGDVSEVLPALASQAKAVKA